MSLLGDLNYNIIDQKQEYGYLKYENQEFEFVEVPYKLAYYTIINDQIKVSDDVKFNDASKLCQKVDVENIK